MHLSCRLAFAVVTAMLLAGCASVAPDPGYTPKRGQPGKDVMWLRTPPALVEKMLAMAEVTAQDRVFDLGSGDGVIPIAAASRFKAQSVGIEYNPNMAEFARSKVREAGVQDKVRIITGDIFKEDFSTATVVTMYLLPELNLQLRPQLLKMKPGTRVVAHAFDMGEWQPDDTAAADNATAFLWIVPAPVQGVWNASVDSKPGARLSLVQSFQSVGGSITLGNRTHTLVGVKLRGQALSFQFLAEDGTSVSTFSGQVQGDRISGTLSTEGWVQPFEARRG